MDRIEKDIEAMKNAIRNGNIAAVHKIARSNPKVLNASYLGGTILHFAASKRDVPIEIVEFLLRCNVPLDATYMAGDTAVELAAREGRIDVIQRLLDAGAFVGTEPECSERRRPIISAISSAPNSLEMVQFLVSRGADPHRVYINQHTGKPMNALQWAVAHGKQDVVDYLLSLGCVMPDDVPAPACPQSVADSVVQYFQKHFGKVSEVSLVEIVPTEPAIAVHVVPPTDGRKHLTLFTTGMSSLPMTVGADSKEYRFGELFIELPGEWKYREIGDPAWGWPIHRLRSLAKLPHQADDSFGPVTIIDNDPPYQPLAPGLRFTSLLLMAEREVSGPDGQTIQLYRLTPLYPEERALERQEGIASLLRAFDKHNVPFIVDLQRKNVALEA